MSSSPQRITLNHGAYGELTSSPSFRKEIPTASYRFCKIASVGTFDPCGCYPDLSPGTHVVSIARGNLLYEIAISSRIDILTVWHTSDF